MHDEAFWRLRRDVHHLSFLVKDLRCHILERRFLDQLKANFNPAQPRAPRGTSTGGQWIDGAGAPSAASKRPLRLDREAARPADAYFIQAGGGGSRSGIGGNRPPPEYTTLQQVFPGVLSAPMGSILAPVDGFLGISAPGAAANLAVSQLQFRSIYNEIRKLDPTYRPPDVFQSLEQMSPKSREAYLGEMRFDRAATRYKFRGEIEPLQVETLRFMQRQVDVRYEQAVREYEAGRLGAFLGRNEAIGNHIDRTVRSDLRQLFGSHSISTARGQRVQINSRAYDTSAMDRTYTVPDLLVGNVAFDMTMTAKAPGSQQISGFFRADARPVAVVIVRPSQLGKNNTYLITRPSARTGR